MILAAFSGGCDSSELKCETSRHCLADSVCVEGTCQPRACISSGECDIEHYCDMITGQCESGCLDDRDCYFGSSCTEGECKPDACRSTTLDCEAGQYCDMSTGGCFDAAGPYCSPCQTAEDCGGGNNRCMYVASTGPYCLPECSEDRPCPAGYDCIPLSSSGEIISYYCVALCYYLLNMTGDKPAYLQALEASGSPSRGCL